MSMKYEAFTWSNISTSQNFSVTLGGRYSLDAIATFGGGSLDVQKLAQDGATFVSVLPATITANGTLLLDLPVGTYKLVVTTATAVYACLSRVPIDG